METPSRFSYPGEEALIEEMKKEVEKFIVDGKHYSHEHPLSVREEEKEEEGGENELTCSICRLPTLSSPSYTCTSLGCTFILHRQCALKLPQLLIHPTYPRTLNIRHALQMTNRPSSDDFAYECEDCEVETHPLLAGVGGVEIKIRHKSHPSHSLVAICKEVTCECDGCGRQQKGFFFCCHRCNFWIHQDCTILPRAIALLGQPDPFFLAYSLPPFQITGDCLVCRKPLLSRTSSVGVYFCPRTLAFAHIACGTDGRAASKRIAEVTQLPDDEWDTFPSRAIRRYAESEALGVDAYYDDDDIIPNMTDFDADDLRIEKYHNHPLILTGAGTGTKKSLLACDLCTKPISASSSSQFHRCRDCGFAAHKICADVLPNIAKFFVASPDGDALTTELYQPDGYERRRFFSSVFYCHFCRRPCNGVCSYFPRVKASKRGAAPICIDLECMAAPTTVNHASHAGHLLFRTTAAAAGAPDLSCCAASMFLCDVYRCIVCDYAVHTSCAALPRRVRFPEYHRRHPLLLVFAPPPPPVDEDEEFCEVCENGIDLNYWLYRCVECDESYHVDCIPTVGYLSKVKFGGEVSVPYCHPHPLALTRMLGVPSQRCGGCRNIVDGMVDEMAFFCSLCHFWLHFSCAANRRTTFFFQSLLNWQLAC